MLIGRYSPKIGYLFHIISINIRDAIHFSLLVALPFRMKRKAMNLVEILRRFKLPDQRDLILRYRMDSLLQEVNIYRPVVTAVNIFQVNSSLVPQLIAAIVSYMSIIVTSDRSTE